MDLVDEILLGRPCVYLSHYMDSIGDDEGIVGVQVIW